jgi:hypothetical protein
MECTLFASLIAAQNEQRVACATRYPYLDSLALDSHVFHPCGASGTRRMRVGRDAGNWQSVWMGCCGLSCWVSLHSTQPTVNGGICRVNAINRRLGRAQRNPTWIGESATTVGQLGTKTVDWVGSNERPTSNKVFCRFIRWRSAAMAALDVRCSTFDV